MTNDGKLPAGAAAGAEVEAFLRKVAATPGPAPAPGGRGRLMFAMDATASRQPTWDHACHLQGEMFETTAALGGLDVQLVFFRGYGECKAAPWQSGAEGLLRLMTKVECRAGHTQWRRVLDHCLSETKKARVAALVCVGDCVEEDVDELGAVAGQLGLLGVPAFLFQEGEDPKARRAFEQVAKLTGGAWCRFDAGSARQLRDLLAAVAVYAAGGRAALEDLSRRRGGAVRLLTDRLSGR